MKTIYKQGISEASTYIIFLNVTPPPHTSGGITGLVWIAPSMSRLLCVKLFNVWLQDCV